MIPVLSCPSSVLPELRSYDGLQPAAGKSARGARLLLAALFILLAPVHSVMAQAEDPAAMAETADEENGQRVESPATAAQGRLPAARHTLHRIHINGEELHYAAKAGAITLNGNHDRSDADLLDPGYATLVSAWLEDHTPRPSGTGVRS
jgi:hypothetical protein